MENSHKVWGKKTRIYSDDNTEIDVLYLNKDSFCSLHSHNYKSNKFYVICGNVQIKTEYGTEVLREGNIFTVDAPTIHQFRVLSDAIIIEVAYTKPQNSDKTDLIIGLFKRGVISEAEKYKYVNEKSTKVIDPNDINRISQGGKFVDGKDVTLDQLRKEGKLLL